MEGRREGRNEMSAAREGRSKKNGRGGEISPPRSFLKVGAYGRPSSSSFSSFFFFLLSYFRNPKALSIRNRS